MSDTNEVLPWRVRRPRPVEAFVSRAARRAATDLGVDPDLISGSGSNGRVTRDDVLEAGAGLAAATRSFRSTTSAGARPGCSSHRSRRPPTRCASSRADYSEIEAVRREARVEWRAREGFSLTYLPFVARAVVDALREYPLAERERRW